jgi:hypothetical protein
MHNNSPRPEAVINSKILNSFLSLFGPSTAETLRFDPIALDRILDANGAIILDSSLDFQDPEGDAGDELADEVLPAGRDRNGELERRSRLMDSRDAH